MKEKKTELLSQQIVNMLPGTNKNVPYKFLSIFRTKTMPLRYRKLWFHLACPEGRIRFIKNSSVQDAASFTVEIYLNAEDWKPASVYTAACARGEKEDYVQVAKNRALNGALCRAGFVQYQSVLSVQPEKNITSQEMEKAEEMITGTAGFQKMEQTELIPFPAAEQEEQFQDKKKALPVSDIEQKLQKRLPGKPAAAGDNAQTSNKEEILPAIFDEKNDSLLSYTNCSSVEEIQKRMTLEDALEIRVDFGVCRGMTLKEISQKRQPSLKWYVYGYNGNDNILRAAAQIVWDSIQNEDKGE